MTTGYGISGIGYPMIGLGNLGLNPSSSYASYDNYMMGMNGFGNMNPSIFGANPMLGYYNPLYVNNMYEQIEKNQLTHAGSMHTNILNNKVQAVTETDRALVSEMLTNASVMKQLDNLRYKVNEGDQDGICQEFDKLKAQIYRTYGDEIHARGAEEGHASAATRIIENLYALSSKEGEIKDLKTAIIENGDGALETGFKRGFRKGHTKKYVDETLEHCYGANINAKSSKNFRRKLGYSGGAVCSVLEKGFLGLGIGAASYSLLTGIGKGLSSLLGTVVKHKGKNIGTYVKWNNNWLAVIAASAAVIAMIGDVIWQISDKSDKEKA